MPLLKLRSSIYDQKIISWYGVDPLAIYNPVMETEFYGDGQHNGGVFYWGNLNPYIYTYQNPINYIDPNGKQTHWAKLFMNDQQKEEFDSHYPYIKERGGSVWLMNRADNYRDIANRFVYRGATKEASEVILKRNGPVSDDPDRGSDIGAYRHALWSGILQMEEGSMAKVITDAHEGYEISSIDIPRSGIKDYMQADSYTDELNNRVGRIVVAKNKAKNNKEVVRAVIWEFRTKGLYRFRQEKDGTYKIYRSRLKETDYKNLLKRYQNLDNKGNDKK